MQLAIVGVGKLGLALLEGVNTKGIIPASEIGLLDTNLPRVNQIAEKLGCKVITKEQLPEAQRILISLQPRVFPETAEWLACENAGYISTMAGVNVSALTR